MNSPEHPHPRSKGGRHETGAGSFSGGRTTASSAARPAVPDYVRSIRLAERVASAGHYVRAGWILGRLRRAQPRNPEVLAVMLTLQCGHHDYSEYDRMRRQPGRMTMIPELRRAVAGCRAGRALDHAQQLLAGGNAAGAIGIAAPLYASGPDPYRAGLILARAYQANHQRRHAARIYSELARRYPHDPELARQAVVANVRAGQIREAGSLYSGLDRTQQQAVRAQLGGADDRIYPDYIAIEAGLAHASGITPSEDYYGGLRAKFALPHGSLIGEVVHAHRFGENADAIGASYYFGIADGYSGECDLSYSGSNTFLAHYSAAFTLTKYLPGYALYGGVRYLDFSLVSANVLSAGTIVDVKPGFSVQAGVYFVPQTSAYSFLFSPQWTANGNRTFLYVTAGVAGEQLSVSNAILRSPSESVRLGRIQRITPTVSVEGDVFYEHRARFYDRAGVDVELIKRW